MRVNMGMKGIGKIIWIAAIAACGMPAQGVTVSFTGQQHNVLEFDPGRNSGLEKVYVAYRASDITEMRISDVSGDMTLSRYSNLGGGYAEPVAFTFDGSTAVVPSPKGDLGYIITSGGRNTCIWLVDYSAHLFSISSVEGAEQQECDYTHLSVNGSGDAIHYYSIDGRQIELNRDIEVHYQTEVWDDDNKRFNQEATVKTLPHLTKPITLTPPFYCSTTVTVSGDRFLTAWGMPREATSSTILPNGISVQTTAEQTNLPEESEDTDPSNVIGDSGGEGELGGSAPADITFTAYVTEAVIHDEWQISTDPDFENPEYRFNERELQYSFQEEGTYYVRYVGSNADGSCSAYGDTYTVSIGASELRIPNAFTPNSDGVNDVWKVAYRSLLSFKCWIFDRYGNQLYYFDNPNDGWDGKHNGKTVKSGVYFYVIEAKGSDGKKYKKGGDINIIDYKSLGTQGSTGGGDITE